MEKQQWDRTWVSRNIITTWQNNAKAMRKQWNRLWVSRNIKTTWENNLKAMGKQWDRTKLRHGYFRRKPSRTMGKQ
jgi:hypothetical protein